MIEVELPKKLRMLFEPHRYKVAYGGRGAAKSWSYARALLVKAMSERKRILCARELQLSIKDSVHRLLCDQMELMGCAGMFDTSRNSIVCTTSGSEFIFSGIKTNVSKIRSMEGVDIVWVEEAESVSEDSWMILIPTIRREGSEIWISFNTRHETDPTYRRFVLDPPPGCAVVKVGWEDNPWLPDILRKEKDYLFSVDPDAAAHVWGGEILQLSDAQVLSGKVFVEGFEPQDDWDGPYQGADWGFARDPTAAVRLWIHGEDLYVEYEAYGVGVDIVDTPALFSNSIPDFDIYKTRADSARPETINHMKQNGFPRMEPVEKWSGSVQDGVAHLRGYKRIVVHPRCKHSIDECRLWSYKRDRLTGDVLPVLVDKNDHIPDSMRYALAPLIRKKRKVLVA